MSTHNEELEIKKQKYIKQRVQKSTDYINKMCAYDEDFKKNVELLDTIDVSEFLSDGRSLINAVEAIEDRYDKEFWEKYQYYVIEALNMDDLCEYFASRYNVWFQEYTDWVVRHDNGAYEKTRRRAENSSGEMAQ